MLLKTFHTILLRTKKVETVCAVLLFGFIVSIIAAQVFVRYVFNKPFPWAEELASLLLIYLTFLTADIVYKDKGHISIDYFVNFLSDRWKGIIAIALYIFIAVFLIVIIPTSITLLKMQYGHITAAIVTLPKSYWTLPAPIAFCSMLVTTVYFILEELKNLSKKEKE